MFVVATAYVVPKDRGSALTSSPGWPWSIAAGAGPVVALCLGSGVIPLNGAGVIPISGIIIGGAMTASTLDRAAEPSTRCPHTTVPYEAALALGLPSAGRRPHGRSLAKRPRSAHPRTRPDPHCGTGDPPRCFRGRTPRRRHGSGGRRRAGARADRPAGSPGGHRRFTSPADRDRKSRPRRSARIYPR